MKSGIPIFAILGLAAIFLCSGSIPTFEQMEDEAYLRPEETLALLDSLESEALFTPFEISYLRCIAYHNGLCSYKAALYHARKAYDSPEARDNPAISMALLDIMANECHTNGDYAQSASYCAEGLRLSAETGKKGFEANFHVTWGLNLWEMGQYEEALHHIDTAIGILEGSASENPSFLALDDYFYALGVKLSLLYESGRYDEAIAMLPVVEAVLNGLETNADTPEGIVDMRRAEMYMIYSCVAYDMGDRERADSLYSCLEENPYSSTADGEYTRIFPLISAGRYDDALDYIRREKRKLQEYTDTVNWDYIDPHLRAELEAYKGKGDWKSASRVLGTMLALTDSLRYEERREDALEIAEIYKSNEKSMEIARQADSLRRHHIVLALLVPLLILLVLCMIYVLKTSRIVKTKNDALVRVIEELMVYKDNFLKSGNAVHAGGTEDDGDVDVSSKLSENDRALFERIEREIIGRRLYLEPDFNKKKLLDEIHVPANKFPLLFKAFAGCSFPNYIQDLRLEHAARLIKGHPLWSLDAVARESQMSKSMFYDLFYKKYGMKPSEFRRKVSSATPPIGQNSV